ncbi:MAG: porin family protein, partial [Ginsengibacter sp.]
IFAKHDQKNGGRKSMQDLEPDMEELFRRASENYPLKQGEDKWSEIASKINGKPIPPQANKQQTRYRKYYVVLLFLLLFVSLEFFFTLHNTNKLKVSKDYFNSVQSSPINIKIVQQVISKAGDTQSEKIKKVQSIDQPINFTNDFELNKVLDRSTPSVMNIKDIYPINTNNFSLPNINSADTGSRAEQFTSSLSNSMHGFYYGLLLGAEVNTVKNQDMKKVGFDIGLIGGYRFNKHFSAETGVLFSQKYYTTAGKYFSRKEIGSMMPAGMKVIEVKGASNVVEIPVHLRYDIVNKKKSRFFSSAGFSSYILTKESNKYYTSLNGTDYIMYGTYKNNPSYFAASLDLAVGYEKNFGKKSNIRFQPYVQLPIKGIGVGNLKVTSAGVHIAITRSAQ